MRYSRRFYAFMMIGGHWQAPAPPVCTNGWGEWAWVKWIDSQGRWLPPWKKALYKARHFDHVCETWMWNPKNPNIMIAHHEKR